MKYHAISIVLKFDMCFFQMSKSTSRIHKSSEDKRRSGTPSNDSVPEFHPTPFYTQNGMKSNPKWQSKEKILGELKKLDVPKIVISEL